MADDALRLIWGRHAVYEALRAGRQIERVVVAQGARPVGLLAAILRLAGERGVKVQWLDRRLLDRLSQGANHQGVLAEASAYRYSSLEDLLRQAEASAGLPLLLALDAIEDPQNFGTLLRSAEAVGASGVVIPVHRSVGVTPAVEKSSAGAVEYLAIARVTNLARALADLKTRRYWIAGLDAAGTVPYDEFAVDVPLVIVVGAEARGLGRLVREACDVLVRLPMRGHIESLNAAVAGSIVLYEVLRRRGRVS